MTGSLVHAVIVLVAAVYLFMQQKDALRIALLAIGVIDLATALGWLHISLSNVSLHEVLDIALAVIGVIIYLRVSSKLAVTAATVVSLLGIVDTINVLHLAR